jgi:hypothetical protein
MQINPVTVTWKRIAFGLKLGCWRTYIWANV